MARKEEYRERPAGINDQFGIIYMNIAAEPEKEETRATAGEKIIISTDMREGVGIKAFDNKNEKER